MQIYMCWIDLSHYPFIGKHNDCFSFVFFFFYYYKIYNKKRVHETLRLKTLRQRMIIIERTHTLKNLLKKKKKALKIEQPVFFFNSKKGKQNVKPFTIHVKQLN